MRQDTAGRLTGTVGLHVRILRAAAVGERCFYWRAIRYGNLPVGDRARVIPVEMRRRLAGLIC